MTAFVLAFQSSLFTINNADGTVTLQETLDYEREKFYQLEIMAKVSFPMFAGTWIGRGQQGIG